MKLAAIAVTAAVLGFSLAGRAAEPERYDVEGAFAETDTSKDGLIEIDEFFDRLVEIYFHGDADKNGTLSPAEFARAIVVPQEFSTVDRNGDGVVDRREFVRARLPVFQEADLDKDGALSLAEVKAALEGKPGR
jgi:Ca2+-binding EF-hand superfamily protein